MEESVEDGPLCILKGTWVVGGVYVCVDEDEADDHVSNVEENVDIFALKHLLQLLARLLLLDPRVFNLTHRLI